MNKSVTTIVESSPLDLWIMAWLHEKTNKTNSQKTMQAYSDTINKFRLFLKKVNLDLDSLSGDEYVPGVTCRQALRLKAQEFSTYSEVGRMVKPATASQRLAILSSFYEYALKHEYVLINPIKAIDRPEVHPYQKSKALTEEQTEQGLNAVDRDTVIGKRDYAILCILLTTGKRVSEVADLERRHLMIDSQGLITVYFERCKGGRSMVDELPRETSEAITDWLGSFYGPIEKIHPASPVWVSLSPRAYGEKLSVRTFANICEKYFKVGKVHATRHTWTVNMLKEGASLQLIRRKLGHTSLATTGIYTDSLDQSGNPFVSKVAKRAGIK